MKDQGSVFEDLFRQCYSSFCFFANRYVKDPRIAEDIVSDTFLRVWERKDLIIHPGALKNYFYTSIRNACLRWLEAQKRKSTKDITTGDAGHPPILVEIIRTELIQELHRAIHQLPPQCRKVFTGLYIEGKSIPEIASELRLSIHTVKVHKKRGLRKLRQTISLAAYYFLTIGLNTLYLFKSV